jgi:hypothetical protein
MTTNANLTKLRKKLIPPPDGQDVAKLRAATVTAVASDGTLTITLNGASIAGVPVLAGSGDFLVGRSVQVLSYRGSLLVIGTSNAKKANSAITTGTASGSGTTGSTGFTNNLGGSPPYSGIHGVTFVAPPSGVVAVWAKVTAGNATAGQYTVIDFEIKTGSTIGSGTTVRSPNEGTAGVHQSATANSQGTLVSFDTVTNLTPGTVYNAAIVYHTTGSSTTSSINRRNIMVLPQ